MGNDLVVDTGLTLGAIKNGLELGRGIDYPTLKVYLATAVYFKMVSCYIMPHPKMLRAKTLHTIFQSNQKSTKKLAIQRGPLG